MDFEKVLDRLYAYTNYEKRRQVSYNEENYNLKRMSLFLKAMGSPHLSCRMIHVAGTKGKGSTVWFLENMLRGSYKTGAFSSPHIVCETERIRINGRPVKKKDFGEAFCKAEKAARSISMCPTVFEFFTAIAFDLFKTFDVDIAVIETGMGGRLDCTNVIMPLASVITPIDYDHVQKLGGTIEAIAYEKAGIIKEGVPVFCAFQKPRAEAVISERARMLNAPLYTADLLSDPWTAGDAYVPFFLRENAALAYLCLNKTGLVLKPRIDGESVLSGRYEKKGAYILDGAHNPFSVKALVRAVIEDPDLKGCKISVAFWARPDKEIREMVPLFPPDWDLFLMNLKDPYISEYPDWESLTHLHPLAKITTFESFKEMPFGGEDGICVVTGSFILLRHVVKKIIL